MKLLIISHTPHVSVQSRSYGWGPTVREINFLSRYFQIVHLAPQQHDVAIPSSYAEVNPTVVILPTTNRGGKGLLAKLRVLLDSFHYLKIILREMMHADIVHVRCPANISLVALCALTFVPRKQKWIKYAGDWKPRFDHVSYKLQRFLIRHTLRNQVVSINGNYAGEKSHIHHLLNPSYFRSELTQPEVTKSVSGRIVVLFVGGLTTNKGADIVLRALHQLKDYQPSIHLHIVGEGPELENLEILMSSLKLESQVSFEGWRTKDELKVFYKAAHFIILPSTGEGWPKVISEAMSFGVVPIVSNVSGIQLTLEKIGAGFIVQSFAPGQYAEAIKYYLDNPAHWSKQSQAAIASAELFTFEHWIENLFRIFNRHWKLNLKSTR
jgi:glycosyltransferase involved in cell wall biosynthesis